MTPPHAGMRELGDNRGEALPAAYGTPFKIRIPTRLAFKNSKFVTTLSATNRRPGGFWVDRGYNWFSGS